MAPNLMLAAKKAVTPWTWCTSNKTDNTRKLYFSREPVPGIYAMTPEGKRYLIALRPVSGKSDTEHIFRDLTSKEQRRLSGERPHILNEASLSKIGEKNNKNIRQYEQTKVHDDNDASGDYRSSEEMYQNSFDSVRTQSTSATTIVSSAHAVKSAAFVTETPKTPLQDESRKSSSTSFASSNKSSIIPSNRAVYSVGYILKSDGALPHQNSPFGRQSINSSSRSLAHFVFHKHTYATQGIQKVDLNGYKFLRQPLRIEYSQITERWMFSAEISARTGITPMCRDVNCMEKDPRICGKTVDMEVFVLDDGESWVRRWKKQQHMAGNIRLYCVDKETENMRRQTVEEVKFSRWRLAMAKTNFLEDDHDTTYMPIVRYLGYLDSEKKR